MRGPSPSRSQNLAGFGAIGDLMNGPVEECPVQSRNVKMAAAPTMSAPDQHKTFGVIDETDSFCWNPPFGSRKLAGRQFAAVATQRLNGGHFATWL